MVSALCFSVGKGELLEYSWVGGLMDVKGM